MAKIIEIKGRLPGERTEIPVPVGAVVVVDVQPIVSVPVDVERVVGAVGDCSVPSISERPIVVNDLKYYYSQALAHASP